MVPLGYKPPLAPWIIHPCLKGIAIYSMPRAGPAEEGQDSIPVLEQYQKLVSYVDDIMPFLTEEEEFFISDRCQWMPISSRPPFPEMHSHAHWQSMEKQEKE